MAHAMDDAGLLKSMTMEQLVATCSRLQHSCGDMQMLLQEFEQEQTMLQTEQDKLQRRIEKATVQIDSSKKDRGILSLFDVDARPTHTISWPLEVQQIFLANDEQKAAKRRRLPTGHAHGNEIQSFKPRKSEENGPFSDASIQMSWGSYVAMQVLRPPPSKGPELAELEDWVRTQACGDSVAEEENLHADWAPCRDRVTTGQRGDPSPTDPRPLASTARSDSFRDVKRMGKHAALDAVPQDEHGGGCGHSVRDESHAPRRSDRKSDAPAQSKFSWRLSDAVSVAIEAVSAAAGATSAGEVSASHSSKEMPSERSVAGQCGTERPVRMNVQADGGQQEASEVIFDVVLRRKGDQEKWGFKWDECGLRRKERTVQKLEDYSVAWCWNRDMEESGQPDKCVKPSDRLVSVNGKTSVKETKAELAKEEVRLEFIRSLQQREAAQDTAPMQQWQPPANARLPATKVPLGAVVLW